MVIMEYQCISKIAARGTVVCSLTKSGSLKEVGEILTDHCDQCASFCAGKINQTGADLDSGLLIQNLDEHGSLSCLILWDIFSLVSPQVGGKVRPKTWELNP